MLFRSLNSIRQEQSLNKKKDIYNNLEVKSRNSRTYNRFLNLKKIGLRERKPIRQVTNRPRVGTPRVK